MCLIAWNWQPYSARPLLLLANRDEFYARPASPLHWWGPAPNGTEILAGQDLQEGGTWLGVSRSGRLAALTNFRSPEPANPDAPSRGGLVSAFLNSDLDASAYLEQLAGHCKAYNPFNLLVFDGQQLMALESRSATVSHRQPGVGAVSNADFETPWPKLTQLKGHLLARGEQQHADLKDFLPVLLDRSGADDASLPNTGIPQELERILSATFIATPQYGTRASSIVAIHPNHVAFFEQSHGQTGVICDKYEAFHLEPGAMSTIYRV